jgi:hypothetical protein
VLRAVSSGNSLKLSDVILNLHDQPEKFLATCKIPTCKIETCEIPTYNLRFVLAVSA